MLQVSSYISTIAPSSSSLVAVPHHHILGLNKITLLLVATVVTLQGATSLQLVNVTVPRYAELYSSVNLSCHFDLSGGILYSVKWYKDDHEFYQYIDNANSPKSKVFPQPGIYLDEMKSGMNQVTLRRVTFNSTGAYRCEVSTEAPMFETVVSTETMTVRALPADNPVITGLLPVYSPGDMIIANCTSPRSRPAAALTWFLNGIRMDRFSVIYYELRTDEDGLSESTLGLYKQADVSLFPLELRCTASVQERTWERLAHASLARLSNQMLAQDHEPGNAAVVLVLPCWRTLYLLTFLILWRSSTSWCS